MKPNTDSHEPDLPIYESEEDVTTVYSLEVIASLAGVDSTTILRYQEQGLLHQDFTSEALRRIRCIHYVETEYEAPPSALKLILDLYDEVENLRSLVNRHR